MVKIFPFFSCPLAAVWFLLLQTLPAAQLTDEESALYMQKGIIPFLDSQQDGDYSQGIYLVPHDLTVDKGKVMTVLPGSTILFKKDTKIIVKGKLVLKGSRDQTIKLCKLDNALYLNPFGPEMETPWDGIYVQDGGELEAGYTHVSDSKYGLSVSVNAAIFLLDSVLFKNNKYQNVTIGSRILPVRESEMFFFNMARQNRSEPQPEVAVVDTIKIPQYVPQPSPSVQQPLRDTGKKISAAELKTRFRVLSVVTAISGAVLGGAGFYVYKTYYEKYDSRTTPGVPKSDKAAEYETYYKTGKAALITGVTLTTIGMAGLTLTFLF